MKVAEIEQTCILSLLEDAYDTDHADGQEKHHTCNSCSQPQEHVEQLLVVQIYKYMQMIYITCVTSVGNRPATVLTALKRKYTFFGLGGCSGLWYSCKCTPLTFKRLYCVNDWFRLSQSQRNVKVPVMRYLACFEWCLLKTETSENISLKNSCMCLTFSRRCSSNRTCSCKNVGFTQWV